MVRTKVFVGNLAFKTTENELAQHFSPHVKVVGVNIISRGNRSLGYGFVELESEEDAEKAVKAMDKKEVDERQINVEVAKPREEGEARPEGAGAAPGSGRGRGRGGFRGGRGGFRGGRGGFRGGRGGRRSAEEGGGAPENEPEGEDDGNRPRRFRRGSRGGSRGAGRGRGGPRTNENRVESKTSVFVANLPFSLTDETFGKVFSEATLKYKSAHVVSKRNGRSKGFGFVEFDNEDDQKKAIQAINGKQVDGRELILKVALTEQGGGEGAPAASNGAAAPAAEVKKEDGKAEAGAAKKN